MRSLPVLGHLAVAAALTTVVSAGVVLAMVAPADAAAPAGISFLTAPPATAVVGSTYVVGVRGGGATTPVELDTQDPSVCSVSASTVTFAAEGVCLLEAHQDADTTHAAADAAQLIDVETAAAPTVAQVVAPRITATRTAAIAPASRTWYRSAVTVTFHCTAGSSPVPSCPAAVTLTRSAPGQTVTGRVVAADGGTAAVTVGPLSIDRVAPSVVISGVRAGASYRGAGPRAQCRATDGLSGVAKCTVTAARSGHDVTVRAVAVDRAGNSRTTTVRYHVRAR